MGSSTPPFSTAGDQPNGQTGDYSNYGFEQIVKAIQGGFSNDPNYEVVNPNPIYTLATDFGEAGQALQYVGLGVAKQVQSLLDGSQGSKPWSGDAANEFAAIMYAVLTWLDDCVGRIGAQYGALMTASGDNLIQAQAGLNKIAHDAVSTWTAANTPATTPDQTQADAWTASDM